MQIVAFYKDRSARARAHEVDTLTRHFAPFAAAPHRTYCHHRPMKEQLAAAHEEHARAGVEHGHASDRRHVRDHCCDVGHKEHDDADRNAHAHPLRKPQLTSCGGSGLAAAHRLKRHHCRRVLGGSDGGGHAAYVAAEGNGKCESLWRVGGVVAVAYEGPQHLQGEGEGDGYGGESVRQGCACAREGGRGGQWGVEAPLS